MFSAAGTIIATAVAIAVLLSGAAHVFAGPHLSRFTTAARHLWKHSSGESEDRFLVEAMGGGVAFIDVDGDGLLDIFFVNGGDTPNGQEPSAAAKRAVSESGRR